MASSYRNKNSVYMEICNRNDSNKGTKVRGGHVIYKNKIVHYAMVSEIIVTLFWD